MDLKEQIIQEYLQQGCGYRKLPEKYGINRTTNCKWVQIYQGVHGLQRTAKQQNHCLRDMDDLQKKATPEKASHSTGPGTKARCFREAIGMGKASGMCIQQ